MKSKLPSGANVSLRKKDVKASLAYMFAFLMPRPGPMPELRLGDKEGMTAGNGREGAGETDRRIDGEEPKEDRRLCEVRGGFIATAKEVGVPGADGDGEPNAGAGPSLTKNGRNPNSVGAGLLEEIRLEGRSILCILLC